MAPGKPAGDEPDTGRGDSDGRSATGRGRRRGRPRTAIDLEAVAEAVAGLVIEGGGKAVSIVGAAEKLDISRATLYRVVPTKDDLVGILFEYGTRQQSELMAAVMAAELPAGQRLHKLVELQIGASVRMRGYMPVFFGGAGLPEDVFDRWRAWSREYEAMWAECVEQAMAEGALVRDDVIVTTRLILGMCMWVSRWYRPDEEIEVADIADSALSLLFPGQF
jgi:AcrR family transcriptional regulator